MKTLGEQYADFLQTYLGLCRK